MKLQNSQIQDIGKSLTALYEADMDVRASMRMRRNVRALEPLLKDIEEERKAILKRHCELDEEGNFVPETDDEGNEIPGSVIFKDHQAIQEEFIELFSSSVEVDIEPIALDSVLDSGVKLSGRDLDTLSFMIDGLEEPGQEQEDGDE